MSKNTVELKPVQKACSPLMNHVVPVQQGFSFQNISTISSEYRIGRLSVLGSSSTLSEARNGGRMSLSQRRYSFPETQSPGSSKNEINLSKLRKDQIIDLMEREQDGMVLKLIKEIELLKEENSNLKSALAQNNGLAHRRTSSVEVASRDRSYSVLNSSFTDEDTGDRKKFKRKSSQEIPRAMRIETRR